MKIMVTFNAETSQWKESVTISDSKIELYVGTMKPCEMCQSMVTCIDFNMHYQLVLI